MSTFFNDIEFTTERIIMWSITLIVFIVVTYLTVADLTAPDNLDRGLRPVRTVKKEDKKEKQKTYKICVFKLYFGVRNKNNKSIILL